MAQLVESPIEPVRTVSLREALKEAVGHHKAGRLAATENVCRQILEQFPGHGDGLHILGMTLHQTGRSEAAVDCLRQAILANDANPEYHANLGTVLQAVGKLDEAVTSFRRSIALLPTNPGVHSNLGACLADQCQWPEAVEAYRQAVALKPDYAEAYFNMGLACYNQGNGDAAVAAYRQAIGLKPGYAEAYCNLGCVYQLLGQLPEAIAAYRQAIALQPNHASAHANLGIGLLVNGEFAEGWREYEWRFRTKDGGPWGNPWHLGRPRWNGESLHGQTLLIHCEQGLGDAIQFIRYLPQLKERGARVVIDCQRELASLFSAVPEIDVVVATGKRGPGNVPFDTFVPLLSIPHLLGTDRTSIPAPIPYLRADARLAATWRGRLGTGGLKVGLVWAGNPKHRHDKQRSCQLADFAPLAGIPGVRFFSLQKGPGAAQAATLPAGLNVVSLTNHLTDMSQTAAAVANLDLLISVDTAVAHLAGALGKPVWMLVPFSPDWRWLLDKEDSPWYPSLRLFRKPRPGDWTPVIERVAATLRRWAGEQPVATTSVQPDRWAEAQAHFQAGRMADAERICRSLLAEQRGHPEALLLLGTTACQAGRTEEGIAHFQRALAARPDLAEVHYNLGGAYKKLGRINEAVAAYRRAVALQPTAPETHYNLANLLKGQGQLSEAAGHYRRALGLNPDYVSAHINLGNLLRKQGKADDAAAHLRKALQLKPDHARAHHNLGLALRELGQGEEAAAHLDEAVKHLQRAVALEPHAVEALNDLGVALQDQGRWDESQAQFSRAIALQPAFSRAHINRGAGLLRRGQVEEATTHFQRAIDAEPGSAAAHFNLGCALLLQGDFRRGFEEYEWRWQIGQMALPNLPQPRWDGKPAPGRTLLLYAEQGMGDAIQFIRYAPQVAERVGRVILGCPESLARLLRTAPGVAETTVGGDRLPPFDCWAPLLSLPRLLGTCVATIPAPVPYLRCPGSDKGPMLDFPSDTRLRVGLVWAGNPANPADRQRSCPASAFQPLLEVPGVAFVSLQKGPRAADRSQLGVHAARVQDLDERLRDWADTAAAVGQLDLVISVDTGVAHLAGALGKPVWTLLPFAPDWRWLRDRDDSPWYPTMRLFRQGPSGAWPELLDRVARELRALAGVTADRTVPATA